MEPRLFIPIGIPGSGKTTWAETLLSGVRVSTDAIRAEWPGGYVYSKESNEEVFRIFHEKIESLLGEGYSIIADATNLQRRRRAPLIAIAERTRADLHYIFFTNVAQAVIRNALRPSTVIQAEGDRVYSGPGYERVPDEAMLRFVLQYEEALKDVLIEPYDTITYIERTL